MLAKILEKYRGEIQRSKQGKPLGAWHRSKRELLAFLATVAAMLAVIVIPESAFGYPLYIHVPVAIGALLVSSACWIAWIAWGREAFPLPNQRGNTDTT